MSLVGKVISMYGPAYEKALVYMMQKSEYRISRFLGWFKKASDFSSIFYRGNLDRTLPAKILLLALRLARLSLMLVGIYLIIKNKMFPLGPVLILTSPLIELMLIIILVSILKVILIKPKQAKLNRRAEQIFKNSKATKIAILGSYGKTTVKELLAQVLSEKYKVAFTPGNMNTQIAHARFALSLAGNEDFIIIEYGEEEPGDVAKMAAVTHPDYAIITGMAPAHLDLLGSMSGVADELGSILNFVEPQKVFWNSDSEMLVESLGAKLEINDSYSTEKALGGKISDIDDSSLQGLKFKWNGTNLQSGLLGRHMTGPLSLVAALAQKFGMEKNQIQKGLKQTKAFEARMQPVKIGSATMINDGYNGNIDGIKAGIATLTKLKVSGKKFYATPGLITQGAENQKVHQQIGQMLSKAGFDKIFLFAGPNAKIIEASLLKSKPDANVEVVEDPLAFLRGIQSFLAAGDVILVQNDLPDGA